MPFDTTADTTADTTQTATHRNGGQPPAKRSAYMSRFCNVRQHLETGVSGLWLRRSRVRALSVTLSLRLVRSAIGVLKGCENASRHLGEHRTQGRLRCYSVLLREARRTSRQWPARQQALSPSCSPT